MEERKIFVCECGNLEHQFAVWYDLDDESLYFETHLITHRNFFKRLWVGLKYAFGYKSRFGEFDEVILDPNGQNKLFELLRNNFNKQIDKQDTIYKYES